MNFLSSTQERTQVLEDGEMKRIDYVYLAVSAATCLLPSGPQFLESKLGPHLSS